MIRLIKGPLEERVDCIPDESVNSILGYHTHDGLSIARYKSASSILEGKFKHRAKEHYIDADCAKEWDAVFDGLKKVQGNTMLDPYVLDSKIALACVASNVNYVGFVSHVDARKLAEEIIKKLSDYNYSYKISSVGTCNDIVISNEVYH